MSEMFLPRFMIAAPNSGSGKTTVVCALLKALLDQEYKVCLLYTSDAADE